MSPELLNNSSASALPWVVQKFGGTSVGKFPDKIARDIVRDYLARKRVIVVCSARSTGKKAEGTTSRLLVVFEKLDAISAMPCQVDAQSALLQEAKELIHAICSDHVAAAQTFVKDDALRAELSSQIEAECHELLEYIIAAKRFNLEANSRSKDRIISIGEKLSCKFMAYLLKDTG
ncbi:unnamed protein product [Parascedosporium putredinis]|uniref:Aspartate/glutamate/uridylate kinase domain-containing protein n=1 Tax=Parascedosporium putredinis TaxID=1442378 RepID=A0A9P1M4Z0_9PEZI|nr:unnamed protein product [Parascedosporium putredinis]CAI7987534.1 unnamed protein product [Parascedosporium putredinis]